MHELGHNFDSPHTHDGYDPPVDTCGTSCPGELPLAKSSTIMSYCHQCTGGYSNIDYTFGGKYNSGSRGDVNSYTNTALAGSVTTEGRKVNARMWNHVNYINSLSSFLGRLDVTICTVDSDCPNRDTPTCLERVCNVDGLCEDSTNSLPNCCGNGECDAGELRDECPDDNCPACYGDNDCNTVCGLEICDSGECVANPTPSELYFTDII